MSHIIVATGVKREAATLGTYRQVVIPGGGDAVALRQKIEAAIPDALGIISFGLGGAVDESLRIGDWVIGDRLTGSVDVPCDRDWIAALREQHPGAQVGTIYSDGSLISSAEEKSIVANRCRALAVDMESHVAAKVAMAHRLPFAILRCVSDEARRTLPPAIAVAMRPDGSVNGSAMLRSIFAKPRQIPELVGSIAGFLRAMRALKERGRLIAQPYRKTVQFSRITLVSSELEHGNSGREGWGFDAISSGSSEEPPYRAFLEQLSRMNALSGFRLPAWQEHEDYVEGAFEWHGQPVRLYYETLLDFLTFWSLDRNIIADLRDAVIRLADVPE